jgi:tRNA nucleotidyltransferase (CCA-adding enzyme)
MPEIPDAPPFRSESPEADFSPDHPTDPAPSRLTVVTTHVNADYDAMACMLAAQKLYPGSVVVFPGAHERTLRNFFIQSMVYLFHMMDLRDLDFERVERLVLVDTRQPARIGRFAELATRADVEVHIYDHHPALPGDIRGAVEVIESTGAAVSILVEIIRERGVPVGADEATLMCLGLYEDTGSFTFASTTEKDFLAGAYLLSRGAKLGVVADLTAREMNFEQVALLSEMLQSAATLDVRGVPITLARVGAEHYVPDFAFLVQKTMKMENLRALFALARMGDKVHVVARSRNPDVDAGAIVRELGGGGHAFAASAAIKDKTLAQVEEELIAILHRRVRSSTRARHLMSAPAIAADAETPLGEARDLLTRYHINALLVTETEPSGGNRLLGYITRQVVARAIHLKLDRSPIRDFTSTELGAVEPDAELAEIQEQIIGHKQRILPVVEGDRILGAITRTDLLNLLVQQNETGNERMDPGRAHARTRNVVRLMEERLPEATRTLLRNAGETAAELELTAYVVGGFVRDLFLARPNEDMDIVVEGDGIAFAKRWSKIRGARVHTHEKFGTAVVIFPDGFKVDVASARMEHYRFPADLPIVEMSSIKMDMLRRDFTINTLAIHLHPDRFGTLIDFFSARKDLKERTIRVLHNLSFVEDPTRVFRAIRFEQRFGFTLGRLTETLLRNAAKSDAMGRLGGRRTFNELRLILEEEDPAPAIVRLHDYGLLRVVHPDLTPSKRLTSLLASAKKVLDWHDLLFLEETYRRWMVYFLILLRSFDPESAADICERLEIAPRDRPILLDERIAAERTLFWLSENMPPRNSDLYRRLDEFRVELLLYMMAATRREAIKKAISHYFTGLRNVATAIRGRDLKRMGIPPGPIYREILEAVLDARLDDRVRTRDDELEFARTFHAERIGDEEPAP